MTFMVSPDIKRYKVDVLEFVAIIPWLKKVSKGDHERSFVKRCGCLQVESVTMTLFMILIGMSIKLLRTGEGIQGARRKLRR